MAAAGVESPTQPSSPSSPPRGLDARGLARPAVIVALLAFVLLALPSLLSLYYVDASTQVAIYAIVALGLGLLVGRVGLVSLGQAAVLALGAWVAARLLFATSLPFPVVLLAAGLITMVLGTLVGLPALRMSGLYLALITLMLAGAITVVLATTNFPNGGHGFLGYNGRLGSHPPDPPAQHRDLRYRLLSLLGDRRGAHVPTRARARARAPGQSVGRDPPERIGGARRRDQHHLLQAVGIRAGVVRHRRRRRPARRQLRYLYSIDFPTQASITLLAVVLMGGIFSLWGAIVAALLLQLLPALLNSWGVSPDWLTILFGIGVLQVLTTAPAGLVDQVPRDLARLGRLLRGLARRGAPDGGHAP